MPAPAPNSVPRPPPPANPAGRPAPKPTPKRIPTDKSVVLRDGGIVRDAKFNVSGKEGIAAIFVTGKGAVVENVEQEGTGMVLQLNGARNFVADGLTCVNGRLNDKAVYVGGNLNEDIILRNFDFVIPLGAEHGTRLAHWKKIRLQNGRTVYLNYQYKGAALTVKHGEDFEAVDCRFDGPVGFEVLPADYGKPGFEKMRCKGIRLNNCEINTPSYLKFGAGVEDVQVTGGVIRAVKWPVNGKYDLTPSGTCLDLGGSKGPWPAPGGTFTDVKFFGTQLMSGASKGNASRWKFIRCEFNGKPI